MRNGVHFQIYILYQSHRWVDQVYTLGWKKFSKRERKMDFPEIDLRTDTSKEAKKEEL